MRTLAAALLAFLAAAGAVPVAKEADQVQLMRQNDIIRMLTHYHQPLLFEDMATIARDYKILPENYKMPQVAEDFLELERSGVFVDRDEPISVFDERQAEQIRMIFDLFYYAKDYDTFYKTALYIRERLNQAQVLMALNMALMMRPDTRDIVLPPAYELYPRLFITSDVIQQVYNARLRGYATSSDKPYYILANYTGYPTAHNPEQKLSYFTEDVGLNEFFANFHYRYPFFLSATNYSMVNGDVRGEVFYHTLRQIFARYFLERLSHGLPDVKPIDYHRRVQNGYYPQISLMNGIEIPLRPGNMKLDDASVFDIEKVMNSEYRVNEAIALGLAISKKNGRMKYEPKEAINMLGNLIESTADSLHPVYYGSLYNDLLTLLGESFDSTHQYGITGSVLGKYETMLRDPVYYQIVKRILHIFQEYQNKFAPYTREEVEFPGLRIESLDVDRLVTFFENFEIKLNNVLKVSSAEEAEKVNIIARQPRLNHKPITYRIKISSEKPAKAIIRMFLGPRFDSYGNEMHLDEARQYFVELDRFVYPVKAGENEITRNSRDFVVLRPDRLSTHELASAVRDGLQGKSPFHPEYNSRLGFPERLALPRGTRDGLPLRLYVIASPLAEGVPAATVGAEEKHFTREWFTALADGRSIGFPFDRRIPRYYNLLNTHMKNVFVVHKTVDEINRPAA